MTGQEPDPYPLPQSGHAAYPDRPLHPPAASYPPAYPPASGPWSHAPAPGWGASLTAPPGAVALPPGVSLSSPGKRFVGLLLESALVVVTLYVGWLVWSLVVWANGQTPAKQILGMKVYRPGGRRAASWGVSCLREVVGKGIVLTLVSLITLGIGWLVAVLMIFGNRHQTLWDKVAGTVVVDDPHRVLG